MHWKITQVSPHPPEADAEFNGRFVLHRHCDAHGPHLDLRLEQDECLLGWRIEGGLEAGAWATEKMPHPKHWLEQDGNAIREDAGAYAWHERGPDCRELLLHGKDAAMRIRFEPAEHLPPQTQRDLCDLAQREKLPQYVLAALAQDGLTARRRAVARFCGLGKELDGSAFDEPAWRASLDGMPLDTIHQHLRAYEVRFDQKYPPTPTSQPEPLDFEEARTAKAQAILREN
jgi:hypothetical protein